MKLYRTHTVASFIAVSFALASSPLQAADAPMANVQRDKIEFSQLLEPGSKVVLGETAPAVSSRSYNQRITGAQLSAGVDIVTQGRGAVVRLTPIRNRSSLAGRLRKNLSVNDLEISANGRDAVSLGKSGALVADQAQMRDGRPDLFSETLAFRMSDSLGSGRMQLRSRQRLGADHEFMVQVFDRNSAQELTVDSARQHYFMRDAIEARVRLNEARLGGGDAVSAVLLGPDGQQIKLNARRGADRIDFKGAIPANVDLAPGELWRVAVEYRGEGDKPLFRNAELPIAIGRQSAAITSTRASRDALQVGVNVREAGRFEVRAWVFGQNADKKEEAAMVAYAAEWLDPGRRTVSVSIDTSELSAAGIRPPYRIKQVRLLDQSRLMPLDAKAGSGLPTLR
ncbi:MAG: DUF4785 domain-containing protein [Pseudomonadota bacterium]